MYPDFNWCLIPYDCAGHLCEKLSEISPFFNIHYSDVFTDNTQEHIKENMEQLDKTLIFCDGGNKIKEFAMYAPLLKSGDRIAVHDWNLEIAYPNIRAVCEQHGLIPDEPYAPSALALETTIMPFRKQ